MRETIDQLYKAAWIRAEARGVNDKAGYRLRLKWCRFIRKCTVENAKHYERFGGRGIRVCEEWRNSFLAFKYWALHNGYHDGWSLIRIDRDKGYSPENCRFRRRKRHPKQYH